MANFPTIAIGLPFVHSSGLDADAQAFLTAAGITDATISNAINRLCIDLKAASIYTKMKALYPLVTDQSTNPNKIAQLKYNLITPTDLDASYRLLFAGGWTYASSGATPNGINGYADTFLNPSTALTQNDIAFGAYCANMASASDRAVMGVNNAVSYIQLYPRGAGDVLYGDANDNASTSTANTTTNLLTAVSRINSTQKIHSIGGVNSVKTNSSNGTINFNMLLGARSSSGTANTFFNTEIKTAFISTGLTTTELTALSTIITTFNTSLGRA
jgi:hypothetical protein